jgi:hypothetical protein
MVCKAKIIRATNSYSPWGGEIKTHIAAYLRRQLQRYLLYNLHGAIPGRLPYSPYPEDCQNRQVVSPVGQKYIVPHQGNKDECYWYL